MCKDGAGNPIMEIGTKKLVGPNVGECNEVMYVNYCRRTSECSIQSHQNGKGFDKIRRLRYNEMGEMEHVLNNFPRFV